MDLSLEKRVWWEYLEEDLQELLREAESLVNAVESWEVKFHDYSFVVFPAAKAYEGFLKKLFLDLGLISERDYYGKRFRIGKALNPELERHLRQKEGVYDKLTDFCGEKTLADKLWETWKLSRNRLFHWFPDEKNAVTFEEAKTRVNMVIDAIERAFRECKMPNDH